MSHAFLCEQTEAKVTIEKCVRGIQNVVRVLKRKTEAAFYCLSGVGGEGMGGGREIQVNCVTRKEDKTFQQYRYIILFK